MLRLEAMRNNIKNVKLFFINKIWLTVFILFSCFSHANALPDYYRFPLTHTGEYTQEKISAAPKLVGKYGLVNVGIHSASKASPIVEDNVIYVGADSGTFYAIDESTMNVKWTFQVRKSARNGIHATAAIDEKFVYVGDYAGWMYQLDKENGRLVEQYHLGDSIGASPVIWNNKLYVGTETKKPEGYVSCIDLKSGDEDCIKRIFLGDHTHATPTINSSNGHIFIGANSGTFRAIDSQTGDVVWQYQTGGAIKSTAALHGWHVLVTSWDGYLYSFDSKKGRLNWKFKSDNKSMSSPTVNTKDRLVHFGSHDGYVYGVAIRTGKLKWKFKTDARVISSASLATNEKGGNSILVIGSADHHIYWLDAKTGEMLHKFKTKAKVSSVPTIKNGKVYVSGDDGFLYIFK